MKENLKENFEVKTWSENLKEKFEVKIWIKTWSENSKEKFEVKTWSKIFYVKIDDSSSFHQHHSAKFEIQKKKKLNMTNEI